MFLPSKAAYAVSALYDLAFHGGGRAVLAKEIAERQAVPLRYLEQILQDLRRAGLVDARRGPRGGYALARPAEEIRLTDALVAVDTPIERWIEPPGDSPRTPTTDVPALVWRELSDQLARSLQGVTLASMVARAEALGLSRATVPPQMYFI
jgi:Rrf2 family transcriptional regulator, iron-sulfur cluster assembly transcription factor